MAVTPVEYLIKANDQFTPVMRNVDAGLKKHQQTVAEMASGGKAAADSLNKLGSVMGMMPVSQLAGQVSALAMQIRGMNAASAAGAQNLALMRLGMVGLAAAAGYQLGQSLAELIYNTTEVGKRIDAATRQIDEGYDRLLEIQKQSRQEQLMDIELIRDPEEKSKRQKDYFDKLQSDLERVNNRIGHDTALLQRYTEEFTIFRAERAENIKETEQRIGQEEKLRQQLQAEVDTIRERNRLEAKFAARQAEDKRLDAIEDMVSKLEQQNEQLRLGTHEYQKIGRASCRERV
jgi:DNA repair exonuclease SbcCD ATPase subunit